MKLSGVFSDHGGSACFERLPAVTRMTYSSMMAAPKNIVILTGAGISAESGIATFRGPGGLWEGHRVEA